MKNNFVTGADSNTEWMLPWFLENYRKHNNTPIIMADFGLTHTMQAWCRENFDEVISVPRHGSSGWFLKPAAMIEASKHGDQTCWIDTDIEILKDVSPVFNLVEPNRLAMVIDYPWTRRFNELWHNSGVVAFRGVPTILVEWEKRCRTMTDRGDQEVLHAMTNEPLTKLMYITDLPNKYNYTRLQIIDGDQVNEVWAMHWTGRKGKDVIRSKMNEQKN